MTTLYENSDLTSIWQLGSSAQLASAAMPAAAAALSLNISTLPTPDQSRIWTFLEFIHEYSQTAWRLQPGTGDADIWFVDGAQPFEPPQGVRRAPTVVHVVPDARHIRPGSDDHYLVRPLDMESFAALLMHLEKRMVRSTH